MRSPKGVGQDKRKQNHCTLSSYRSFVHDAQEPPRWATKAAAGGRITTVFVKKTRCTQYLSFFLGNMEPIKLRKIQRETKRQSDAEVLNLVLWDLPAISSHFLSHDLGYVPLCISPFG